MTDRQSNQGEGNKDADRRYREKTETFAHGGEVEGRAKEAAKGVTSPGQPPTSAEKAGRERAAEFDPEVARAGKKAR
ncbi:hypothetical protein SAMN06265365_101536 [Tistlia consotensis]|uniref:Uncharacterized protein n=1 Tax=Tistlia consotensis USBA 355 TaxID=560819 RepID=A0A1Y6BA62_9PROT|nr:hypothetical protein [Tistlia consotensis]SME92849.1 hypothetical protein SAMN05428998_101535 [Tistlia consotensis USBA 355]SNR28282.1 hypothetical protein SAMN06265365_101536 [Tistlia consotensis]